MSKLSKSDYTTLLSEIKQRIRSAQYEALKAVNKELIALYWDIGKLIVEKQKARPGASRLSSNWQRICAQNFLGLRGFQCKTSGICGSFI
jgi:hypothetical protein